MLAPASGAYLGSILDWAGDSVASQQERLGAPSAVYEHAASVPMTAADIGYLSDFFDQVRRAGSFAIVTLKPKVDLATIDADAAARLVDDLSAAWEGTKVPLYVRFGPDMNSSWVPWGQDPVAYRAAFQAVAAEVHGRLGGAVMVWSPAWGGGYPFTASRAATIPRLRELDTSGDGLVDSTDDAYAPYYPGDAAADWVGLSLYHDDGTGATTNSEPASNEFVDSLGPATAPDSPASVSPATKSADPRAFYATYAAATGKSLLLETAAFYNPSAGGPSELDIKRAWWRQIFDGAEQANYPNLDVVLWRDTTATRGVQGEESINWSISLNARTAAAVVADLDGSAVSLGPLTKPTAANSSGSNSAGTTIRGWGAWLIVVIVFLSAAALFVWALLRRGRSSLAYTGPANRDHRIDLLRGIAIVFVVVNHIGLVSVFQNLSQEAIGAVSGAELFVLLSGTVLGMVYRPKLVSGGIGEVVIRTGRRAWKLYYTTLAVVLLIFFLSILPFVNGYYVTSFTDQGTGALGDAATGRVYNLYTNADQLLQYPVSPQIIIDLLMLRLGPWQFNVMGLYVVLLIVSPLILWALSRRWWIAVLSISGALYAVNEVAKVRLLPSQFENSFPLLSWQFIFVLGMVGGFYRREILAWFRTRVGTALLGLIILLAAGLALFSLNNPYLSSLVDVRVELLPDNVFRTAYAAFFERTYLEIGRLINVVLVVVALYALFSAYWRPIDRAVGWFFIPLGQATLYVFIMHVFFALAASNIPALAAGDVWLDTAAYIVILGLLWIMVKKKFLFGLVPR